jgi:sodium/bile acid cotransporter 7
LLEYAFHDFLTCLFESSHSVSVVRGGPDEAAHIQGTAMRTPTLVLTLLAALAGCSEGPSTAGGRSAAVDDLVQEVHADFPDVKHVTARDLMDLLEDPDGVLLVDVRTEAERAISTIPGAISQSEFEARREDYSDRTIVAYCTIGVRSSRFAREMKELGLEVANLDGSILAWTHEGGTLVSDGRETTRVHVYGARWDLAAEGYETIW